MKLTCNHKDKEIASKIMDWLFVNCDIEGNEQHLENELFTAFLGKDEIYKLEAFLSRWYDENIELPKDLRLIKIE